MAEPLIDQARRGPLLAAKCSIPPQRPGGVVRRRLHDLLLDNAATRLTAVAAPAGWGKTTLLSQWAHDPREHRRVAWVSLDESDDDPVRFWTYVMTALRPHGLGAGSVSALGAPGVDPIDVAVPLLLNELESATDAVVLVLDDFHLLSNSRVHEGVEFLLAYLPASMRLVVAGRTDPPLPLPRLRARGELTEIRAEDLRFSVREAGALVGSVGAVELDDSAVHGLCERTEGWAAGLQLAAITLRGAPAPAAVLDAIRGDDRHILDYFTAEVFEGLPASHRDLLVRASVLERLSGPLCDAVLQRTGSAAILDDLSRADLFVVALDRPPELVPVPPAVPGCSAPPARIRKRRGKSSAGPPTGSSSRATSRTPSSTASSQVTTRARPSCSGPRCPGSSSAAARVSPGWAAGSHPLSPTPTLPCASRWPGPPRSAASSAGWAGGSTRSRGGWTADRPWGGTT